VRTSAGHALGLAQALAFDYDAEMVEAQRHVDQLPVVVLVPDTRIE
jgi:hypothetical protein